jgi:hypothetical protein
MAIQSSEILTKYSTKSGSAGNTTAGTAAGSLGLYISTTQWAGGGTNDLFDNVSATENAALTADYRCVFVHNTNTTDTLSSVVVFIPTQVAGGAVIAVAADTTAASAVGSSSAQALTATSETAPGAGVTGLTYSSPTTSGTGVSLGNIPAGFAKAFWVRRTPSNSGALATDGATITITGSI